MTSNSIHSVTTAPCLFLWLPWSYSPVHLSSCARKGKDSSHIHSPPHVTLKFGVSGDHDFPSSAHRKGDYEVFPTTAITADA